MFSPDTISSPPPGRARLIVSLFIGAYVLWQVALPFRYYLGDDLFDERFAWRMFSSTHAYKRKCEIKVYEWVRKEGQKEEAVELTLRRAITAGWVSRLRYSPAPVVEKFLRSRCQANPAAIDVEMVRYCPAGAGHNTGRGGAVMNCDTGIVRGVHTLLRDIEW